MRRFVLISLLTSACLGSACSKEKEQAALITPATTPALPALELAAAVPVEAAGVLVVRTQDSLYATFATLDVLGQGDPADVAAMRAEIDELLTSRLGMTLTTADRATAFYTAREGVAVVLQDVDGTPRGNAAGEAAGIPLVEADGVVMGKHPDGLVLGERAAVVLALETAAGKHDALRDSNRPLRDALVAQSEGTTLIAAVDVAQLPAELRREAAALGVEQAMLSYGSEGIRAAAYGPPESLARLRELAVSTLDEVTKANEAAHAQALAGDRIWTALPAVWNHYQWKQMRGKLVPTLEGGRLGLHVPVRLEDPMVLTAFAGMAAAIAVPALTKYTRRSSTSEARVGVAKMFDAIAVFFNEEHPGTPPHRCPSDGRAEGGAGPTPPLSLRCAEGPGGKCVPVKGTPRGPGEYSMDLWLDDPVWRELGFVQEQPHAFHYGFRWANGTSGFGSCQFTAQAFGDLDDDGLFSTYERAGAADENGINAAAGLYIDQEIE